MATTAAFFSNSSLIPSGADLFMAVPRLGSSLAGLFGFNDISWFGNATGNETSQVLSTTAGLFNWSSTAAPVDDGSGGSWSSSLLEGLWLGITRIGNMDGVFSYLWSKWAVSTIILAAILNRAHVFASTRDPIRLSLKARILLRFIPVILLLYHALTITQALRCQTGYELPQIRFKESSSLINKSWVSSPGLSHKLTSWLLFWQSTEQSCMAVNMIPQGEQSMAWQGSTTFLWPLFIALGTSQLMENVASALRGSQPNAETGMSIFEHSLAFAEAETVARATVGIGLFGLPKGSNSAPNATESDSPNTGKLHTFTRTMLLQKLNVPPEVLLICLISICSHLSSHLLGIAGLQHRYRLINTGIWATCFITLFVYSFVAYAQPSNLEDVQIIRYPTVCIIGFVPHILALLGATICAAVYSVAMASAVLSKPVEGTRLICRLRRAHANMSASASWTNVQVSWHDDFYQAVLRVGYQMLSAAAEAVYFNEGLKVTLNPQTWLEKARYDEATKSGHNRTSVVPLELQEGFAEGDGFGLMDEPPQTGADGMPLASGYARERKTMANVNKSDSAAMREEGVGIAQRSGRFRMSVKLVEQISELMSYCSARATLSCLERVAGGKVNPPNWLVQAAKIHQPSQQHASGGQPDGDSQQRVIEFWRLTPGGELQAAKDGSNIDVEYETRRRFAIENGGSRALRESRLDDHLYDWWKANGWWGEKDSSGEYRPPRPDDFNDSDFDATSQITGASSGWESESMSSAASDSTIVPVRSRRRAASPSMGTRRDAVDDVHNHYRALANLLDPKTFEHKQDARLLAHRLRHADTWKGPMTRSKYRRSMLAENMAAMPGAQSPLLSADDEVLMLDHLISTRRQQHPAGPAVGSSWREGGAGMGEGGPQCAVCHSSPRSVLVWPCRCLSLCEDCRVTLAENNFASCVCCRRDVVAFSRLYVP